MSITYGDWQKLQTEALRLRDHGDVEASYLRNEDAKEWYMKAANLYSVVLRKRKYKKLNHFYKHVETSRDQMLEHAADPGKRWKELKREEQFLREY